MSHRLPSSNDNAPDLFSLPSPADLCNTPLAARYKLSRLRDLENQEWDEVPTRPIRLATLVASEG